MNKKEELKRLLKEFNKEELMEIIVDSEKEIGHDCPSGPIGEKGEPGEEVVHPIDPAKKKRRRGKGTRSRGRQPKEGAKKRSTKTYGNNKGDPCRTGVIDTSRQRPNKFDDFMKNTVLSASERHELEEASKADAENKDAQRAPRSRQSALVEVECRTCGAEEEVSPAVIYDMSRWKCNKCSSQACD